MRACVQHAEISGGPGDHGERVRIGAIAGPGTINANAVTAPAARGEGRAERQVGGDDAPDAARWRGAPGGG